MLLRTVIGGVYLPFSGFRVDVGDFGIWAAGSPPEAPASSTSPATWADYPPGYMYVLWLLGGIGELLRPDLRPVHHAGAGQGAGDPGRCGRGRLLFIYCRRWGDGWLGAWSGERLGLVAVVIYLFNPGTIFDSAVWGQVDSVGTLVVLATLYMLARGWTELRRAPSLPCWSSSSSAS